MFFFEYCWGGFFIHYFSHGFPSVRDDLCKHLKRAVCYGFKENENDVFPITCYFWVEVLSSYWRVFPPLSNVCCTSTLFYDCRRELEHEMCWQEAHYLTSDHIRRPYGGGRGSQWTASCTKPFVNWCSFCSDGKLATITHSLHRLSMCICVCVTFICVALKSLHFNLFIY